MANTTQYAALLGLPPELRARIFRHVFAQQGRVTVDCTGLQQHSLLFVNKLLRSEAVGIFYTESDFEISTPNWNPAAAVAYTAKISWLLSKGIIKTRPRAFHAEQVREPNWANFLRWLRALHAGEHGYGVHPTDLNDPQENIISGCLRLAWDASGVPWEQLEETFEWMHGALEALDPRWA